MAQLPPSEDNDTAQSVSVDDDLQSECMPEAEDGHYDGNELFSPTNNANVRIVE